MSYVIRDLQTSKIKYFTNKTTYQTKIDALTALILHHQAQGENMEEEKELLKKGKIHQCEQNLKDLDWEIIDLNEKEQCPHCKQWVKSSKIYSTHLDNDHPQNIEACQDCYFKYFPNSKPIIEL